MTTSDKNETYTTQGQWRKLGFFYEFREKAKSWYFAGSKDGLRQFNTILREYVENQEFNTKSSHEHYGPYMYLEIMTWDKPGIDCHSIHGTKNDIARLAKIFLSKLNETPENNHFIIGQDYAPDSECSIFVDIKSDGFDPALLDT